MNNDISDMKWKWLSAVFDPITFDVPFRLAAFFPC